jgi:photosystem II stability/assembly factor-like uncharacterized protein
LTRTEIGGGAPPIAVLIALALALAGCQADVYDRHWAEGEIDGIYDDLYTATAHGPDHLWVAGYFGTIYRTTDGGSSWRKLDSHTQKSIYGISFGDSKSGWAVGRRGYVIHTSDAGDSWERQDIPRRPTQHIFAIDAIDARRVWAVGEWGGRYFTEDGGVTWQDRSFLVHESHPVFQYLTEFELERFYKGEKIYDDLYLNDVFFLDKDHGWIVGEYGLVFTTADGGDTWNDGRIIGEVTLDDLDFDDMDAEIARERWGQLFEAAEALNEREYMRVQLEGFMTPQELKAHKGETFLADERAESVRDFLEGEGVGQERIRIVNRTPLDEEAVDLKVFAATKTAERPYVKIEVVERPFLFDVKFSDPMNGVVSGLGGVVLRSEDGGLTWRYAESASRQALFAIGIGSGGVIAVGEKGLKRVSRDGGRTFEEPGLDFSPPLFQFMRDLVFATGDRGWIVGAHGLVLKSSDGGLTWRQVLPPTDGVPETGAGE